MTRLPTEEGRVWSGKVAEERTCAAAAVETAPLSLLLPLPFGVRGTKGLTFSKVYVVGLCLLLEGLFMFLLI